MRFHTQYLGRFQPFERDRRLVLHRLPQGAVVSRAQLVLSPYSLDAGGQFLETLTFPGPVGDWGASKRVLTAAVELDLRARRRLASMVASPALTEAPLLVDLGGGFMTVNSDGGLGGEDPLKLNGTTPELPGLTVTGLRVVEHADIAQLQVASPPSDVTVAVEGGPVFFTHLGELVTPATTPDFSALLQALLPDQPVEGGHHVVTFVVHSGSIARLDLDLEIEHTLAVDAMPDGVAAVTTTYAYDGVPAGGQGRLTMAVPPGTVAVPGASAGRAQGAFEATRVVFGDPLGEVAPHHVVLDPSGPLAQPFVLPSTQVATSVDLLLTAVTAQVSVAVDLVDDLDGKPGRGSLLPRVAELTLTRDQAGWPTWLNVPLPGELEIPSGTRRWLVLQARDGTATWGAALGTEADQPDDPGLQRTGDGGLSWRVVPGGAPPARLRAQLRLRHTTGTFHMPLELRAATAGAETRVSLQRFDAQGAVDIGFDIPEVAEAVNTALAGGVAAGGGAAEAVANGDFVDWYRVGAGVQERWLLRSSREDVAVGEAIGFGPDSGTAYAAGAGDAGSTLRFLAFDAFCGEVVVDADLGATGFPVALAVDPSGRHAVVAAEERSAGYLTVADTATGRPLGVPVPTPSPLRELAVAPDGTGLYLLGREPSAANGSRATSVRFVAWSVLVAAAGGSELDWTAQPAAKLEGEPLALAVGSDGRVYVLIHPPSPAQGTPRPDPEVHVFADTAALTDLAGALLVTVPGGQDLAVTVDGRQLLVLTLAELLFVDSDGRTAPRTLPLGGDPDLGVVAVVPPGELALVVRDDKVVVVDLARRALLDPAGMSVGDTSDGPALAVSPAGTHGVVTRSGHPDVTLLTIGAALPVDWQLTAGTVEPLCLPGSGEIVAVLGNVFIDAHEGTQAGPVTSSISQVVPATGGAAYRFGFDAISLAEDAVGQVIWRGDDCVTGRTDRVPIAVVDLEHRTSVERLPHHQLDLVAPAGATQAEVRFFVPDGTAAVDKVSLVGSADMVGEIWEAPDAGVSVTPTGTGFTVSNGGPTASVVTQVVQADAGARFDLDVTARVPAGQQDTAVELVFSDEQLRPLEPVVRLALDPIEFDDRAASGRVPDTSVAAELRLVVPPGGSVDVARLTLSVRPPAEVDLHFAADAPGELAMTGVVVVVDQAEPVPAPLPAGGLCRPAPVGPGPDGEACYCGACGAHGPPGHEEPMVTDADRPASVSTCPVCGSSRMRLGGPVVAHARRPNLARFRVQDRPAGSGGPAITARLRVDVPLVAIRGIGSKRAAKLRALGILDVLSLARADSATVATLRGVSPRMAAAFIADATRLVRERGRRVLFDVPGAPG
jgi:DNA-binding beta-propeller fold protein YncE